MSSKRNVYLNMKPLQEAREILFDRFPVAGILSSEVLPVPDAVGRALAEPVISRLSSPNSHVAAMDGIAVKAETTFGAHESRPKSLVVGKDAHFINTGHVMPDTCNAVIMIENVQVVDDNTVDIEAPAFPWQHVRKMGEDIVATELLFPQNHLITPYCVGALLSAGLFTVPVWRKPRVLIIPTGSELLDWQTSPVSDLRPGQVIETNSAVLGKMTEAAGGIYVRHDIIKDDLASITRAVKAGADSDFDMVLTLGGSSAGSEDYAKQVITQLGEVLVHGVTIMPGKPILIGAIDNTPFFGIPGYPVSAIIAFEQFVGPLLSRMRRQPEDRRNTVRVELTRKIASKLGVEEFLRVKLGAVADRIVATPLPRGAGSITSLTEADGIIRIPAHMEGFTEDDPVVADLLHPPSSIHNTIVCVGSHDNTLDVLADEIKANHTDLTLSSSHVGSLGGLMALKKGVCHIAGSHLLDPEDGSYNLSYVEKYLADDPVLGPMKIVNLVDRDQGLIVPLGNPKGIKGIEDLSREDIRFINRQAGSGTRVLLDYRLEQLGLAASSITGYEDDEFTHMAVAVAVLSGTIDVGLGIFAAAKALDLDFVPVITEQYDLIIPQLYFETANIQHLLDTIAT
ncbi:MAG: molybdopterin biosynthesis protein, partial [Desulfobacterales bacterium]